MRRIPSLDVSVRVRVYAKVEPFEDPRKVELAIKNVVGNVGPKNAKIEEDYILYEFDDERSLYFIYSKIRDRQVVSAVKRLLLLNKVDSSTKLMLNRQVAYIGNIVVCEEEGESPLGPIFVEIESPQIDNVIEWLAGETF
ncbi:MAG: RNA-binding domain-containing protein [Nitrososphaeria archaeon]